MDTQKELLALTKKLFHCYLLEPTEENFAWMFSKASIPFTLIGTGKHEVYHTMEEAVAHLTENQKDAQLTSFELLDEWYECTLLQTNAAIVYGGIWVREREETGRGALVDMDTRFTVVYTRKPSSGWKVSHVHHSMPYWDQADSEYYPKALSHKVREALELVQVYKQKAETDLMTGIYNHDSFLRQVEIALRNAENVRLYVIDLDNFKAVNDSYGHITGDMLLKCFAKLLAKYYAPDALVGRLGGDEFAVCETARTPLPPREDRLVHLQIEYRQAALTILHGNPATFTVGIAEGPARSATYSILCDAADKDLYRAKQEKDAR